MAGSVGRTSKRRGEKTSVDIANFKAGDIIEYRSNHSLFEKSYDLLLEKSHEDDCFVTFKIMALKDGVQEYVTYFCDGKYRVH